MFLSYSNYPWLSLPHNVEVAPNEAVARTSKFSLTAFKIQTLIEYTGHPHLQRWKDIGHAYTQRWHKGSHGRSEYDYDRHRSVEDAAYPVPKPKGCNVQVVRSVSDWSHGVLTEKSIQSACK